jgi:hypothetical protein
LDLSFCVRGSDDPVKPGFYLIASPVLPADCPPVASDRSEKAAIVVSFADDRQPFELQQSERKEELNV